MGGKEKEREGGSGEEVSRLGHHRSWPDLGWRRRWGKGKEGGGAGIWEFRSMGMRLGLGGAVEEGREEAGVGMGWSFWSPPARILGENFVRSMEVIWMAKILFGG
jgi:hypothetical protein